MRLKSFWIINKEVIYNLSKTNAVTASFCRVHRFNFLGGIAGRSTHGYHMI